MSIYSSKKNYIFDTQCGLYSTCIDSSVVSWQLKQQGIKGIFCWKYYSNGFLVAIFGKFDPNFIGFDTLIEVLASIEADIWAFVDLAAILVAILKNVTHGTFARCLYIRKCYYDVLVHACQVWCFVHKMHDSGEIWGLTAGLLAVVEGKNAAARPDRASLLGHRHIPWQQRQMCNSQPANDRHI